MTQLLQSLPDNDLDIVGDVHGELSALRSLLDHLGYDATGRHPNNRKLVFVGDLCDRGPDSPGVIELVQQLVNHDNAQVILGNHELNLLTDDAKDGSGWFFDERFERDLAYYWPFRRAEPDKKQAIRSFLSSWPVALQRSDLRVVHAAWTTAAIEAIKNATTATVVEHFNDWEAQTQTTAQGSGVYQRYLHARQRWAKELESESDPPPYLDAIADYEAMQQTFNPLKVLTSGVECPAQTPFFAGNRWRFSDRTTWWNDYDEDIPVVIGHYWRLFHIPEDMVLPRYSTLFGDIPGSAWHGRHRNVFCVDFSVGARWRERKAGSAGGPTRYHLAALQWPEKQIVLDDGRIVSTT